VDVIVVIFRSKNLCEGMVVNEIFVMVRLS